VYLACDSEGRVVALLRNGAIKIFDKEGKLVQEFDSQVKNAAVVACGAKGTIYVVGVKTEVLEGKVGNRVVKREEPVSAFCRTLDATGKVVKDVDLQGAKAVTSGTFLGGRLLVADRTAGSVILYNVDTGAKVSAVGRGVRLCCGIFGFGVNARNEILIANLGAFKVDRYSADGKPIGSFGKRGADADSFHGCCNPVNIVALPDGRLMTAEKDTTRIKIYDATGKVCEQVLPDVTKLVEGCAYIPMAVDPAGNVYLANTMRGNIVKCGPKAGG